MISPDKLLGLVLKTDFQLWASPNTFRGARQHGGDSRPEPQTEKRKSKVTCNGLTASAASKRCFRQDEFQFLPFVRQTSDR